jgi:hypothetical protein
MLLSESSDYKYACVMALLSKKLKESLLPLLQSINKDDLYIDEEDTGDNSSGLITDSHVTCLYGLHDPYFYEVKKVCDSISISEITMKIADSVSVFDTNDKYDVLKIDIISPELQIIRDILIEEFECTIKFKQYTPHLTLAYILKGTSARNLRQLNYYSLHDTIGAECISDRLAYQTTDGMRYEFPLVKQVQEEDIEKDEKSPSDKDDWESQISHDGYVQNFNLRIV